MSGRINYSNLSDSLKEKFNNAGLTEEQVQGLIDEGLVDVNTDITNIKNDIVNVQKFKLTTDEGQGFGLTNQNADDCVGTGIIYFGENITNSPACAVGTWWTIENYITTDGKWGHQIATAWHDNAMYIRRKINGTFDEWRKIAETTITDDLQRQISEIRPTVQKSQQSKMTDDYGICMGIPNNNANDITVTGCWMGPNVVNGPSGVNGEWIYLESFVHNDLYQMQRATDLHDSSKQWVRHKTGGNWSNWRSL